MKLFVAAVLALSCFAPMPGFAQATDSGKYSYCWVKDADKHEVWLSQVFPMPPGTDPLGTGLATEFHAYVDTLGGAGATDKLCVTVDSREVAESRNRAEAAAVLRKRSFGMRVYDLHEVNWTPRATKHTVIASAPVATPAAESPVAVAPAVAPAIAAAPSSARASGVAATPAPMLSIAPAAAPAVIQEKTAAYEDIDNLIASNPFFRLPAGTGASLHRSGSRVVNKTLPVMSNSTMQRVAGSNKCQLEQTVYAGEVGFNKTTASGQTWAGFIPLVMNSKTNGKRGVVDSVLKAVAIEKTVGQPFPLIAGNRFGWSASYESVDNASGTNHYSQEWSCTVGETAPASTSIPALAGEQTEVLCHLSFVSVPVPPQVQVFVWYGAAGCFMQDPNR